MSKSAKCKKMLWSLDQEAREVMNEEHAPFLTRPFGRMDYKPQTSAAGMALPFERETTSVELEKPQAASSSRMMLNYERFLPPLRKTAPRKIKGSGSGQRKPFQPRTPSNNMKSLIDSHYFPSTVENLGESSEHTHKEQESLHGVQNCCSEIWNRDGEARVHGSGENPTAVTGTGVNAFCDLGKGHSSDSHCRKNPEDKVLTAGKYGNQVKVRTDMKYTCHNQDIKPSFNGDDSIQHEALDMCTNFSRISKKRKGKPTKSKASPLRVMPMRKVKRESTGRTEISIPDKSSQMHGVSFHNNQNPGPKQSMLERECSLKSAYEKQLALSVEKSSVNFSQRTTSLPMDTPPIRKNFDSPEKNVFDPTFQSHIMNVSSPCKTPVFQQWQYAHGLNHNGCLGQSSNISGIGENTKLKQMDAMCQTSPLSKIYLTEQSEWEQLASVKPKRSFKQKLVHRFSSRRQQSNKSPESPTTQLSKFTSYKQKLVPHPSLLPSSCSIHNNKKPKAESETLPVKVMKKGQCHPSVVMALKKLAKAERLQKKSKAAISGKVVQTSSKHLAKQPARQKSTKNKKLPQPKHTEKTSSSADSKVSDFQEHFEEWTKQIQTKQYLAEKKKVGRSPKTLEQKVKVVSRKRKYKDVSQMSSTKRRKIINDEGKTDSVHVYPSGKGGSQNKNMSSVLTSEEKVGEKPVDKLATTSNSVSGLKTTNSKNKSAKQKHSRSVAKTRHLKGQTDLHSNSVKGAFRAPETLFKMEPLRTSSDNLNPTTLAWKDSSQKFGRIPKKASLPNPVHCNSDQDKFTSAGHVDPLFSHFNVSSEDIDKQLSLIRKELMPSMCLSDSEYADLVRTEKVDPEKDHLSLRIIGSDIQVTDNSKLEDPQQKNCEILDLDSAANTEESNEEFKSTAVCTSKGVNSCLPCGIKKDQSEDRGSSENLSLDSGIDDESSEFMQQHFALMSDKESQSSFCSAREELETNAMQGSKDTIKKLSPSSMNTGAGSIHVAAADTCLTGDADVGMSSVKIDTSQKSAPFTNLITKTEDRFTSNRCRRKSLEIAVERLKKFGIQKKKIQQKNAVDSKTVKVENIDYVVRSDKCLENESECQPSSSPVVAMANDYHRKNHDKRYRKDGKLISEVVDVKVGKGLGVDKDEFGTGGSLMQDMLNDTVTQNKETGQKTREPVHISAVSLLDTTEDESDASKPDRHVVPVEIHEKDCDRKMSVTTEIHQEEIDSEKLATEEKLEKGCPKLVMEKTLEKEHQSEKLTSEEVQEENRGSGMLAECCGTEIQIMDHGSASQLLEDKSDETEKVYTDLEIEDVLICKQKDRNVDDEITSETSDHQKDGESSCNDSRSTAFIKYARLKSQYWRGLGGWEESLRQKPNKTQLFQVEPKRKKRPDKADQVRVKDRKGEKRVIKDDVSSVSDDSSNASSKEMETENNADVGRLVWAKLGRGRWWPGMIITGPMAKMKSAEPGFYWVFWFGDHKISQIAAEKVMPFVYNFNNMIGKKPGKIFQSGVLESLKICAERCELEEEYLVSRNALFHWAVQGFQIPENVCGDLRRSPFDPKPSENVPELVLENLQRLAEKAKEKNDLDTKTRSRDERDSAMELVKSDEKNIQEICIACDDITKEVVTEHPLFHGGLCRQCKDELTETLYACGQDGTNVFCVICGCGGELFVCDMLKCGKAYCTECLEVFLGEALVTKIRKADPWRCLLCAPYNVSTHGQLKPKTDWQQRVVRLYDTGYRVQQPADLSYLSSDNKKPIRVLSLFDGIGTGKLILDQLGFDVDSYYSSEIDHDALLITSVHHGNSVTQVGDITQLNEEKLQKLCPIDLVIGGSPCNDLSLANPARRGFEFGGTGMLFFHFYRVLKLVQILNHNRHVFWLYENVASMKTEFKNVISSFFECGPALWDAKYLTPQTRARYFWGNIPGMYSTPEMCEQYVGKSASLDLMLVQNCNRKAVVEKLRTVTTRSNSLMQGKKDDIYPISMNGKEDHIWISELEMVFGFPAHYTDVGNLPPTRRQKLLGKSWSVPVVQHILSPLATYFSTKGDNSSLAQENLQEIN